ncbi:TIGR03067 domain-containing protein [Thalassoglobus sp. JC818]|uniref:TIGR03067 domain-containing protein n=1 Tax=Thalassoglobus sp. JC818 TaxID=3232136 RepID=UPI0034580407
MKFIPLILILMTANSNARADDPMKCDEQAKSVEQSVESFHGTWEIIKVQPPESTKDAKRLVFRKDGTYAALDADNQELWAGTYDLDASVTPKIWDHRSYESAETGADALGIYKVNGDKLTVCCVVGTWKEKQWTGKPRPSEFKLPAADVVIELQRIKTAP